MALAPKRTLIIGGALVGVVALYALGAEKGQGTESTADTGGCRVTATTDGVRIRTGPDLNSQIVGKLNKGQETNADKVVQNGFRKIAENQWISVDFTQPLAGRDCG
jgi:uncharacterized protein YgiM (DUF1202 family)